MSNVTVNTATTIIQLVGLETVRTRMGLGTSFDNVLSDIIDEVSALITKYTDRTSLAFQTYSEKVPGYDSRFLLVKNAPIVSITSITNATGTTISSTAYEIYDPDAGVIFNSTGWEWDTRYRRDIVDEREVGSEKLNYTVTYGAGWRLPGTSTASTTVSASAGDLPLDIRRAAMLTAIEWFGGSNLNVTTTQFRILRAEEFWIENMGDVRTADFLEEDLPRRAKNLLDPYVLNFF
jgi:hypothetical protein